MEQKYRYHFTVISKQWVELSQRALKHLDKFSDHIAIPILTQIKLIETNPKPNGVKKLKGREGYRIGIGNYQVIYEIIDSILIIDVLTIARSLSVFWKYLSH